MHGEQGPTPTSFRDDRGGCPALTYIVDRREPEPRLPQEHASAPVVVIVGLTHPSEKRNGNIEASREPLRAEIETEFCYFLGENDLNSEKGGICESPPDGYVPKSSPARYHSISQIAYLKLVLPNHNTVVVEAMDYAKMGFWKLRV